ncbi:unnamed protein product, partial [Heterosigma akashiwo]
MCKAYHVAPPPISPATKLPNQIFDWRGQKVRYQVAGPPDGEPAVLVHGLFVNSDHWRKTLLGLSEAGYRAYAIDLLGSGYSSKPPRNSPEAKALNGENGRFISTNDDGADTTAYSSEGKMVGPSILPDVQLGTANGGSRIANVDLRHPLNSCYNFYTWAEQIADFTREVVLEGKNQNPKKATLVCNSIGTISSLQAAIDAPQLYNGCFVVNPNFRELHSAEVAAPSLSMPVIRVVQRLLRERGQGLFEALAKPATVRQILMEPYKVSDAVDDDLVDVLLTPLLTPGASDVVFDTLSYSAGPLPEQQLAELALPVWVVFGAADPWTPPRRVEALAGRGAVERVVPLAGVGHCPHDEAPERVNPLLLEFL